jgi:chaperonin GroES
MKLKPLSNKLFLEPIEEEMTTESGIVIPETAEKERPQKGKVLAVGPGRLNEKGERIPMSVREGDMVLFKKYGPDEIEIDKKKYLVADEDDVLAVILEK